MANPGPLLNVYPSETEQDNYLLVGLVADGAEPDEQIQLKEVDSDHGEERILKEAEADEYGYFYISGICLKHIDFTRKSLIVNFVCSGHRTELDRGAFEQENG